MNENLIKENEISLSDILLSVSKQIKIILLFPFILVLVTFVYLSFFAENKYESYSKIISSSGASRGGSAAGLAAQFGINLPSSQKEGKWLYQEIIKSKIIAKSLLKKKFETVEFGVKKPLIDILTYELREKKIPNEVLEIIAANTLINMIGVSENIKTSVFTISITSKEAKLSALINGALIDELDNHQQNYNKGKTSKALKFIKERILEVQLDLQNSEESLKIFLDRNRRIENSPALQLEQQRLLREVNVLTSVFTTLKQQQETTKIEYLKESNYIVKIDDPETPLTPSYPKKSKTLFMSLLIGLLIGSLIAFLNETYYNIKGKERKKINKAINILKNIIPYSILRLIKN